MKEFIHAKSATGAVVSRAGTTPVAGPSPTADFLPSPPSRRVVPIVVCVIVLLLGLGGYLLFRGGAAGGGASAGRVATVERKDFVRVLRLTGTTQAVRSRSVLAPQLQGAQLGALVITRLAPAGARVRAGGVLVEFDRQAQYKDFLDKQAAYRDLADQVTEKQAAGDAARVTDQTALRQAEDALATARLEVAKNELVSRINAEENEETLEEAESTLQQLRRTYALKRQAAAADIRTVEIQAERARQTMLYAQANAGRMAIRAPIDGVVVLNTIWLNGRMGQVEEGTEVRPGLPFLKVVDPSQMEVSVQINQADLPALHVGQHARVSLDAYPGLSFPATLEELSPLAHNGQFSDVVRIFAGLFSIEGNNPQLMPDLSAAVDVEVDRENDALVVPRQSVATDKAGDYVWVKTNAGFRRREVRTGPCDDLETVIEAGLHAGDSIREDAGAGGGAL